MGTTIAIISWLLKRIQRPEPLVSQNKQYSAEVLAILLQSTGSNRAKLIESDGIDILLQLLSTYRKRDPSKGTEEEEYVENLFDCVTCCTDDREGKAKFLVAEGIELCLIMLREGKMSKPRALRLLDHALGGPDGAACCEKLVEAAGLKVIFSIFMKKVKNSQVSCQLFLTLSLPIHIPLFFLLFQKVITKLLLQHDSHTTEHVLGILSSMLRSLPSNSDARIRLLAKFVEKEYEKLSRLVTIRREFTSKMSTIDHEIALERSTLSQEVQEEREDEWFSRKLDAGLFSLQVTFFLLFVVWTKAYNLRIIDVSSSLFKPDLGRGFYGEIPAVSIFLTNEKDKKKLIIQILLFCTFLDNRCNPHMDGSRRHRRQAQNRTTPLRSRRKPPRREGNPARYECIFFLVEIFFFLLAQNINF